MNWICAHCSKENGVLSVACRWCDKPREDKIFPGWQRCVRDPATDTRKYADGGSKWAAKKGKKRKRETFDW